MVAYDLEHGSTRPGEQWQFRCECAEEGCLEWVDLDLDHYERITQTEGLRVLADGHPISEARRLRAQAQELKEDARALRAQASHQRRRSKGLLAERDGLMFIPLDDRSTRRRLLEHLRNHHYLTVEHKDGVVAQPLNPISVRHDRAALSTLVRQWITRGDAPPTGRDQPGS